MSMTPFIVYLTAVWLFVWFVPGLRNFRFVAFLLTASILMLIAGTLPSGVRDVARLSAAMAVGGGMLWAERLGLGSLTRLEHDLDQRLSKALKFASIDEGRLAAIDEASDLLATYVDVDTHWRATLRIFRRAWSRRVESHPIPFSSPTPARSFEIAGARYLTEMRLHRTIGYRPQIGEIEEDVALRAYLDDFRSLASRVADSEMMVDYRPRRAEAESMIAELLRLRIRSAQVAEMRDRLADLLRDELELGLAATSSALAAYESSSIAVATAWRRLEAQFQPGHEVQRS